MIKDISKREDIELLVNEFYGKVREDRLLGPIFNEVIGNNWPKHLNKMYGFWETVLLNVKAYSGSPFPPHTKLPIQKEHFDQWLSLFHSTIDKHFKGDKAEEAKSRSTQMGMMFNYKLEYLRNQK